MKNITLFLFGIMPVINAASSEGQQLLGALQKTLATSSSFSSKELPRATRLSEEHRQELISDISKLGHEATNASRSGEFKLVGTLDQERKRKQHELLYKGGRWDSSNECFRPYCVQTIRNGYNCTETCELASYFGIIIAGLASGASLGMLFAPAFAESCSCHVPEETVIQGAMVGCSALVEGWCSVCAFMCAYNNMFDPCDRCILNNLSNWDAEEKPLCDTPKPPVMREDI